MSTKLLEKTKPQPKPAPASVAAPATVFTPPAASGPVKRPPPPPRPDEEDDEPGFFERNRVLIGLATVVIAGAVYAFSGPSKPYTPSPVRKVAVPIEVTMPAPPPPPPPPPKVEPPKLEEKMEEETAPVEEAPPEAPSDPAPSITSNGPAGNDKFGLSKGNGGSGNGTVRKLGGTGSKYGYYAGQVQNSVSAAVRRNSKTKSANMSVIAKIWADETGRVTRAVLSGSSGDPAIDAALKNEVLTGLQLQSPPPAGMKMPINLRLTARAAR